ncbi:MAG: 50S ribosomal protein L25 [Verrucomicrobiia bacterium]
MAKQVSLKAFLRTGVGRPVAKRSRAEGMIPAIIYGAHIKPTPVQVPELEVTRIFKHATSESMLVQLTLEEKGSASERLAFIQEIQRHPLTDRVLHLDFHEVRADEKLHARVPIVPLGEAEGVRTGGGVLEQALRELEVECFPKDLPERIEVDVSALVIGANIHVNQLKVPADVLVLSHAGVSVFSVLAPVKEEVVAPTAAAVTEPEMIKEKKVEGEEGAEAKTDAKGGKPADAKGGKPADAKGADKAAPAKGDKAHGKGDKK